MGRSVGFFGLGREYARSADYLSDSVRLNKFDIARHQPVDFLYAHALELMFKGCLLEEDSNTDVGEFGHDLLRLYDELRTRRLLGDIIKSVEQAVRNHWKQHLRDARDRYQAKLGLGSLSTNESDDLGIYGNDVIGSELPELRKQVIWLSERHSNGGGTFRYLKCGLDQRAQIKAFGLSDDVVWRSSQWACDEIYNHFRRHYSSKRNPK